MKNALVKVILALLAVLTVATSACMYSGIASHSGKLYVTRNDWFLFGALRQIYICSEALGGKRVCKEAGQP